MEGRGTIADLPTFSDRVGLKRSSGTIAAIEINWPDDMTPDVASFHAVNELQIDAPREHVWEWLRRPALWPSYYGNCWLVKHHGGPWPAAEAGTRFRWVTFGLVVQSEIVECSALD